MRRAKYSLTIPDGRHNYVTDPDKIAIFYNPAKINDIAVICDCYDPAQYNLWVISAPLPPDNLQRKISFHSYSPSQPYGHMIVIISISYRCIFINSSEIYLCKCNIIDIILIFISRHCNLGLSLWNYIQIMRSYSRRIKLHTLCKITHFV